MTFTDSIVLYKTPLDADYANVYDDYETTADYVSFLNIFTHINVELTNERIYSRKNVDDLFEFVLVGYDSMDLHDYNYMKFTTAKNETKFAFILSIDSENDNQTNPSVLLHCKLDSWSNHYTLLKNERNRIVTDRATIDTNKKANFPDTIKLNQTSTKKTIKKFLQSNNENYCVLWQRIVLTKPANDMTQGETSFRSTGGTAVVYKPVAMLKNDSNILLFDSVSTYIDSEEIEQTRYIKVYYYDELNSNWIQVSECPIDGLAVVSRVKSSFAVSNTLTYTVPFKYYIEENSDGSGYSVKADSSVIISTPNIYNSDPTVLYPYTPLACGNTEIVSAMDIDKYGRYIYVFKYNSIEKQFTNSYIQGSIIQYNSADRYVRNVKNAIKYEQELNEYPFKYYSVYIGQNEYPIVGKANNFYTTSLDNKYTGYKFTLELETYYKLDACLYIYSSLENNFIRINSSTIGEMDISELAYDEYMMRNSNMYNWEGTKSTIKSLFGIANILAGGYSGNDKQIESGARGTISGVSSLIDLEVKAKDLQNTTSQVNFQSFYPQSNPYQLDLIILVENVAISVTDFITNDTFNSDDSMVGNYILNTHFYGNTVEINESLTAKNRDLFDYSSGVANISVAMSNGDKGELINAFSKGVTRWHIKDYPIANDRMVILASMNKLIPNFSISLIPQGE